MSTAQLWTILGVMLVVFVALGTTMVTLFLHMDKKIDAQGDKIEKLALAQAEMNGRLETVLTFLPHPQESSAAV